MLPSSFVPNWLNLETATFSVDNTEGIWAEFEMADSREGKVGNCSVFREAYVRDKWLAVSHLQ